MELFGAFFFWNRLRPNRGMVGLKDEGVRGIVCLFLILIIHSLQPETEFELA